MRRLLIVLILALCVSATYSAIVTVTISRTIHSPGGVKASGGTVTATLSTSGTSSDGTTDQPVAGRVSATISSIGAVSLALVPNDTITPAGTYYTIKFSVTTPTATSWTELWSVLSDGTYSRLQAPSGLEIGPYVRYTDTEPSGQCSTNDAPKLVTTTNRICVCSSLLWVCASSSGGHTIRDESSDLAAESVLQFTGDGVSCADNSGVATVCTIAGSTPAPASFTDLTSGTAAGKSFVIGSGSTMSTASGGTIAATSFATDPDDCAVGRFATAISASGNLTCSQVTGIYVTGPVPTASALYSNPADCSAGQFATAIAASGNLTCSAAPTSIAGTANEITASAATGDVTLSLASAFDISGHTSTKPTKTGTSVPGSCSVGMMFFDTDATAGQNVYGCTSTDTWTLQGDGGGVGGSNHNFLSSTHPDTTAASPTRGDIITAQGASPSWTRLAKGTPYNVLYMGANEPAWGELALDQDAAVSGILPGGNGGTGNGFMAFSGPASSLKTYTLPNASTTILTTENVVTVPQGGTGKTSWTQYGMAYASDTTTLSQVAIGTAGQYLRVALGATGYEFGLPRIESAAAPTVAVAGDIAADTTDQQLKFYTSAVQVVPTKQTTCQIIEYLAAADDAIEFWMAPYAVTVTSVGCRCRGTCSTPATFTLQDRGGNAMTITGTNPTCATTGNATYAAVTAGNGLVAGEGIAFNVTNTPVPDAADAYTICIVYTVDAQ